MLPSISLYFGLRPSFTLCLAVLFVLPALFLPALGQSDEDNAAEDADSAEIMDAKEEAPEEMKPPLDLQAIAALEYSTYDTGWVRYLNGVDWDNPVLHAEGISQFPFRTVSLPARVNMELLQDLDFVGAIIEEFDLHYDEAGLQGICDTERMRRYQSTDALCVPGTSVMAPGLIISVLYHPETNAIVALTTTIDNIGGYATRADEWKDLLQTQAADPAPAEGGDSCGPWNNGRWLTAAEYQNSGVSLPINTDRLLGGITHYECSVPENGAPFLIAWTVVEGGGSSNVSSAGGNGGGNMSVPPSGDNNSSNGGGDLSCGGGSCDPGDVCCKQGDSYYYCAPSCN